MTTAVSPPPAPPLPPPPPTLPPPVHRWSSPSPVQQLSMRIHSGASDDSEDEEKGYLGKAVRFVAAREFLEGVFGGWRRKNSDRSVEGGGIENRKGVREGKQKIKREGKRKHKQKQKQKQQRRQETGKSSKSLQGSERRSTQPLPSSVLESRAQQKGGVDVSASMVRNGSDSEQGEVDGPSGACGKAERNNTARLKTSASAVRVGYLAERIEERLLSKEDASLAEINRRGGTHAANKRDVESRSINVDKRYVIGVADVEDSDEEADRNSMRKLGKECSVFTGREELRAKADDGTLQRLRAIKGARALSSEKMALRVDKSMDDRGAPDPEKVQESRRDGDGKLGDSRTDKEEKKKHVDSRKENIMVSGEEMGEGSHDRRGKASEEEVATESDAHKKSKSGEEVESSASRKRNSRSDKGNNNDRRVSEGHSSGSVWNSIRSIKRALWSNSARTPQDKRTVDIDTNRLSATPSRRIGSQENSKRLPGVLAKEEFLKNSGRKRKSHRRHSRHSEETPQGMKGEGKKRSRHTKKNGATGKGVDAQLERTSRVELDLQRNGRGSTKYSKDEENLPLMSDRKPPGSDVQSTDTKEDSREVFRDQQERHKSCQEKITIGQLDFEAVTQRADVLQSSSLRRLSDGPSVRRRKPRRSTRHYPEADLGARDHIHTRRSKSKEKVLSRVKSENCDIGAKAGGCERIRNDKLAGPNVSSDRMRDPRLGDSSLASSATLDSLGRHRALQSKKGLEKNGAASAGVQGGHMSERLQEQNSDFVAATETGDMLQSHQGQSGRRKRRTRKARTSEQVARGSLESGSARESGIRRSTSVRKKEREKYQEQAKGLQPTDRLRGLSSKARQAEKHTSSRRKEHTAKSYAKLKERSSVDDNVVALIEDENRVSFKEKLSEKSRVTEGKKSSTPYLRRRNSASYGQLPKRKNGTTQEPYGDSVRQTRRKEAGGRERKLGTDGGKLMRVGRLNAPKLESDKQNRTIESLMPASVSERLDHSKEKDLRERRESQSILEQAKESHTASEVYQPVSAHQALRKSAEPGSLRDTERSRKKLPRAATESATETLRRSHKRKETLERPSLDNERTKFGGEQPERTSEKERFKHHHGTRHNNPSGDHPSMNERRPSSGRKEERSDGKGLLAKGRSIFRRMDIFDAERLRDSLDGYKEKFAPRFSDAQERVERARRDSATVDRLRSGINRFVRTFGRRAEGS